MRTTKADERRVPASQIRWIVGNRHVSLSERSLIRELRPYVARLDRRFRHAAYRIGLRAHRANRQLVRDFRL